MFWPIRDPWKILRFIIVDFQSNWRWFLFHFEENFSDRDCSPSYQVDITELIEMERGRSFLWLCLVWHSFVWLVKQFLNPYLSDICSFPDKSSVERCSKNHLPVEYIKTERQPLFCFTFLEFNYFVCYYWKLPIEISAISLKNFLCCRNV